MNSWEYISKYLYDPIVIALIGALAATILYFKFLKHRDKRIAKKAFKSIWINSKKIKYKDLSGRKEYVEKYPSTQTHLKDAVTKILNNGINVLLISEAMAGKTYFTINYLKKLENTYVLIPHYDKFDELYEFIPKVPRKARLKIILLDDIYTYFNTGAIRLASFIEKAIDEGYIIWANTISGNDFETVRNNIPIKILSTFQDILIPSSLNKDEALKIANTERINQLPSYFDGNIGSIFNDITQVKFRFSRLDRIGKLLLLTIKQLYLVGIYTPPNKILKSNLRKLVNHYETDISSETISKKIEELEINGFLLHSRDPLYISFEEKYLRIVVEPELRVKDFIQSISDIFPKNVATYTMAMQSTNSYSEAIKIYHQMIKDKIQPNIRPFVTLIGKANDADVGLTWLKEMDKFGLDPDDYVINSLLRTSQADVDKKERVIAELRSRNIEVREKIQNIIKAPIIQLDLYGYSNLMNLSGNFEKALEIFNKMKDNNINPDVVAYNILVKLSNSFIRGNELLNEMLSLNVKPNNYTYAILINLAPNYNEGINIFESMVRNDIEPNEAIYGTLMKLSKNFIIGKNLIQAMREKGITISAGRYGFVINLSPTFSEGKKLFDEMLALDIIPTCKEYGTLIHLSNNFVIGRQLFDEMISKGIEPDISIYGTLMDLSHNYANSKKLFDEMIERGVKPGVEIYAMLIRESKNIEIGRSHLKEMLDVGIKPNIWIYNSIIWLYKDNYQQALAVMQYEMKDNKIQPNVVTYTQLMNISRNFNIAIGLLEEMGIKKINPNEHTLSVLMSLAGKDKSNHEKLNKFWKYCYTK